MEQRRTHAIRRRGYEAQQRAIRNFSAGPPKLMKNVSSNNLGKHGGNGIPDEKGLVRLVTAELERIGKRLNTCALAQGEEPVFGWMNEFAARKAGDRLRRLVTSKASQTSGSSSATF